MEPLDSYLQNLLGLFKIPKANLATKWLCHSRMPILKLICCKCALSHDSSRQQYELMENFTPVSARALLLVLESIESNVELNDKPPIKDKTKGADPKQNMDLVIHIWHRLEGKNQTEKHCSLCRVSHHTQHQLV